MKLKHVAFIIILILAGDQALKIWVKTHMLYHEERMMLGSWFRLYFIENEGMAYGWKIGGEWGKLLLTLFRLAAVLFGTWYLAHIVKKKYHTGFIICAALIYAGALGNLIDSLFYGIYFDKGMYVDAASGYQVPYEGLAKIASKGYSGFLHGNVVDMLYFPMIDNYMMPNWVPILGGKPFTFFSPIFNIADASISCGVIVILLFQKRFFRQRHDAETGTTVETNAAVNDEAQVL